MQSGQTSLGRDLVGGGVPPDPQVTCSTRGVYPTAAKQGLNHFVSLKNKEKQEKPVPTAL
jgi:hypothetical protein